MPFHRSRPGDGPEPSQRLVFRLNLRNRRLELKLSQRRLAELITVAQQWISAIESGRGVNGKYPEVSMQLLEKIAAVLETTSQEMLTPNRFLGNADADTDMRTKQWAVLREPSEVEV